MRKRTVGRGIAVLALTLSTGMSAATARANCREVPASRECLGCANIWEGMEDAKSGTTVHGTVQDQQLKSFEGVLVEVFRHPEVVVPMLQSGAAVREFRIAACLVGKDGKFSFHLDPGKYEMRFSKDSGWNCTYQKVEIIEDAPPKRLRVLMKLGT